MIELLTATLMGSGLVKFQGVSIRNVTIILALLYSLSAMKYSRLFLINLFLFTSYIICYFYLYVEGVVVYSDYFVLYTRNLVLALFVYNYICCKKIDFSTMIKMFSYFIIFCAFLNIIIILTSPKPWIVIASLTGADEDNFGHLYNRLIMPFGTPNQLGFVSALLIIYSLSVKDKITAFLLTIPLLGAASNSSLIPLSLIAAFHFFPIILKRKVSFKLVTFLSILVVAMLSFALFSDNVSVGRDHANMVESSSRHLMLRLQTLEGLGDFQLVDFLYGVGVGNSHNFIDGTYSFTIPLTLIFEMGIGGVFFYYILPLILVFYFPSSTRKLFLFLVVFASLLYQLNNDVTYYLLPIILAYQCWKNENENSLSV